ncbi:MAG: type I-MYXAN CRISPR-associated protein Cas6/Cmx6 [Pseudomonadota bacterium]
MVRSRGLAVAHAGELNVYWQESQVDQQAKTPCRMIDVVYNIDCRTLPVDHAWALSHAVIAALPWLPEDPRSGVHTIHVADSGNGWMRPEAPDALLYLSRRTRLVLRVPAERLNDARQLCDQTLDVAGNRLAVGEADERSLSDSTTIFSRYVLSDEIGTEQQFLQAVHACLGTMAIKPPKMLCGIEHGLRTPEGLLPARSLMLADLTPDESQRLQEQGLGPRRHLGCGLFIPHKGVRELHPILE